MSPNTPDHPESHESAQRPGASDDGVLKSNPYLSRDAYRPSQDDLDAGAPVLSAAGGPRVNRKALVFLAGILGLLALMAVMVFKGRRMGDDESLKAPRAEQVVVPALPTAPPLTAEPVSATPAIELAPDPTPFPQPPSGPPPRLDEPEVPHGPTLAERRMMAAEGQLGAPGGGGASASDAYMKAMLASIPGAERTQERSPQDSSTGAQALSNPSALLVRGTYIRCAMETRIVTDVDGFASCVVTEPVYSANGRRLLLPKGSKVSGTYSGGDVRRDRVAIIWDRITTPNGIDVTMASPGVDNLGGAGHPGYYNAHWGSRISSALFISLLSDAFKYYGERNGPTTTTTYPGTGAIVEQPFQSNVARTIERLAGQAVEDSLGRRPTITINQGAIVNVYVSKDVDFSGVVRD